MAEDITAHMVWWIYNRLFTFLRIQSGSRDWKRHDVQSQPYVQGISRYLNRLRGSKRCHNGEIISFKVSTHMVPFQLWTGRLFYHQRPNLNSRQKTATIPRDSSKSDLQTTQNSGGNRVSRSCTRSYKLLHRSKPLDMGFFMPLNGAVN